MIWGDGAPRARALALGLVLAAPARADTASVVAHLEGEKAECDFLLGLCRAANRAAQFARDTPITSRTDVLATATRVTPSCAPRMRSRPDGPQDKHGGKPLECFDDRSAPS